VLAGISAASTVLTTPAQDARAPEPTFAAFLSDLEQGQLREVVRRTRDNSMSVTAADHPAYDIGYPPEYAGELVERLRSADVEFDVKTGSSSALARVLQLALPVALLVGVWLLVVRRRTGAGSGRRVRPRACQGARRRCPADHVC
jgi:ATP-dependent Zn protease